MVKKFLRAQPHPLPHPSHTSYLTHASWPSLACLVSPNKSNIFYSVQHFDSVEASFSPSLTLTDTYGGRQHGRCACSPDRSRGASWRERRRSPRRSDARRKRRELGHRQRRSTPRVRRQKRRKAETNGKRTLATQKGLERSD